MSKPLESQTKTKVFPTIGNDFIVNADNNKKEKKTSTSILVFFLLLRLFEQLWRRVYSDKRTKTRFLVGTRHIIVAAIKARKNRRRTEFGAEMQILSADDEKKCVDLFYVAVFFHIFFGGLTNPTIFHEKVMRSILPTWPVSSTSTERSSTRTSEGGRGKRKAIKICTKSLRSRTFAESIYRCRPRGCRKICKFSHYGWDKHLGTFILRSVAMFVLRVLRREEFS